MESYTKLVIHFMNMDDLAEVECKDVEYIFIDKVSKNFYCPIGDEVIESDIASRVKIVLRDTANKDTFVISSEPNLQPLFKRLSDIHDITFIELRNENTMESKSFVMAYSNDEHNKFQSIEFDDAGYMAIRINETNE